MTKKKKDIYEEAEQQGTTLEDFLLPQKLTAFVEAYQPVASERMATQMFNEGRLRSFFNAQICTLGDPLRLYLAALEAHGFRMEVHTTGEPVILCTEKRVGGGLMDLL